jgi:excisionase family DNA binding protein
MEDEPLWTTRQVAAYLAVSEATVRSWQQSHRIPFIKVGGSVRYVPGLIRKLIQQCQVDARDG